MQQFSHSLAPAQAVFCFRSEPNIPEGPEYEKISILYRCTGCSVFFFSELHTISHINRMEKPVNLILKQNNKINMIKLNYSFKHHKEYMATLIRHVDVCRSLSIIIPTFFLKKVKRGYCNRLRASVRPLCYPPKPLDEIQPNWCLCVLHMIGACNGNFFGPAPWGPGEGSKGQISFNFDYKVNFKDFLYQTVCLFSQIIDKTYQTGF